MLQLEEGKIAKAWIHTVSPLKVKFDARDVNGFSARSWVDTTGWAVNEEVRVTLINGRLEVMVKF